METYEKFLTDSIGKIGRAQVFIVLSIRWALAPAACSIIVMSFVGATPKWFKVPLNQSSELPMTFHKHHLDCIDENSTVIFDASIHTIVNEWELICNRKWIISAISTTQMTGVLIGAVILGQSATWFGRKKTVFLSYALLIGFLFLESFSTGWKMMIVCAFFVGAGVGGFFALDYGYAVEFISTSWRTLFGILPTFAIGVVLFGCAFKLFPNWRHLFRALAVFALPSGISLALIPESPRWLFTQGRFEEGKKTIRCLARMNKLPEPDFECFESFMEEIAYKKSHEKKYTYLALFKFRSTRLKTVIFGLLWFYMASAYYGLTLGVSRLSGDMTVNVVLMGLTEVACNLVTYVFTKCFRRRNTTLIFIVLSGVSAFAVTISYYTSSNFEIYKNIFALIARSLIAAAWLSVIIHNAEAIPTVLRTTSMSFSSVCGRLGGILAPQYNALEDISTHLPFTINGVLGLIVGFSCLLLKDTYRDPLPDNLKRKCETETTKV